MADFSASKRHAARRGEGSRARCPFLASRLVLYRLSPGLDLITRPPNQFQSHQTLRSVRGRRLCDNSRASVYSLRRCYPELLFDDPVEADARVEGVRAHSQHMCELCDRFDFSFSILVTIGNAQRVRAVHFSMTPHRLCHFSTLSHQPGNQ